jgi:flagellar assembly factor FliW
MEYQKYVENGGKIFLPVYKEKHINEVIDVSYEIFNEQENSFILSNPYNFREETNEPEGSYTSQVNDMFEEDVHCGQCIESDIFGYNFEEFLNPIYDGPAKENEEYSPYTLLDLEEESTYETTYEHSDEGSQEDMPEIDTVSNSLLEVDFLCNQDHQHHGEDNSTNFGDNIIHDIHSQSEIFLSSSYEPKLYQKYEDDIKLDKHSEKSVLNLKHSSNFFSSIVSNQSLDQKKPVVFEDGLLSNLFCEENQHLEYGNQEYCVEKIYLGACMIDQRHDHKDLPFGKEHIVLEDLSKAKQESHIEDCIHKAETVDIAHMSDAFDTGMKYEQHTEVSILEDSMIIFIKDMFVEVFSSFCHNFLECFSSMYTNQMVEARSQMLGLNGKEIYFFPDDHIDRVKVNSKQMMKEKYMLHAGYFLTFVDGLDFNKKQCDIIFRKFKVLHDQNRVFDRGKK